ncbi:M20 family metallo-hydrolase [Parabacteroides sp. AD58]|uniref:M20 family metallo-hydrolase n=1 Tax=Parabacteroides absconsus TaxID=2951805 RepID=A0ABZ2IMP2_9BACT|nr:M20 family metallo-hydrolase [Parabacteroides sp. AD58]MCM6902035.1 M20 family metallo-hydrolase [Parabacteroides sp. AD58]
MYYEAVDILKGMIAIPSFSREEKEVADFLENKWKQAGQKVFRRGNNLWMIAGNLVDPSKPTLLLNSHIDTVKPVSAWTRDPFTPEVDEEDRLYGLGSNDAGASVVSLYGAFTSLSRQEQPYNLIFLASCEEEVSGKGGIESVLPYLPPVDFAIVGEPTGMQPAVAEKGLMVLDCTAVGKAGHAARNEGVNAIYEALSDIEWFRSYVFPEQSDFLGPVKMSVTMINAGTQHNVVPDKCTFVVDVRTNEFYTNERLYEAICQQVKCEVKARSFRLNSSSLPLDHPFLQRTAMMDLKPFGSPTLSDQALMPFPSVKIGPGQSSRSHTADEYIGLMEIREAIQLYVTLLNQLKF